MVQINQGPETVQFAGRAYRKFWPRGKPVTDGAVRCWFCGQIDEDGAHNNTVCPAMTPSTNPQDGR